jgi:hypothetical protein
VRGESIRLFIYADKASRYNQTSRPCTPLYEESDGLRPTGHFEQSVTPREPCVTD